MESKNKLMNILGFAKKAGKISSGEGITLENIKKDKALVVVLANDASENTSKRIKDKASYRNIEVIQLLNRKELGRAIGVDERVVISITDKGFAQSIKTIVGGNLHGENTNS